MPSNQYTPDRKFVFQSELVFKLSWIWIVVNAGVMLSGILIYSPASLWRWVVSIIIVTVIGLVSLLLNRLGYTKTASYVLPGLLFLHIVRLAYTGGGTALPGIMNFIPIVLTTGFLLGRKNGLIMAFLCVAVTFALALMETHNLLPPVNFSRSPIGQAIALILPISITASIQFFATKHIENANRALKKSKANLQTIMSATDVVYALIDEKRKVVSFNKAAFDFVKRELQATLKSGDDLGSFFRQERAGETVKIIGDVLSGKHINHETDYIRPDGTCNYYQVSLTPVDDGDSHASFLLTLTDITERKRAQAKIVERESQLTTLFENMEGATSLLDIEKKYVLFNKRFIQDHRLLSGTDPYVGQLVYDFLPPDILEKRHKMLDNVLKGNKEVVEADHIRNDKRVHYRSSFSPVITDGKVIGISTFSLDLSKSKEAEIQIRESEEKFRMSFMTSQDAFYIGTLADGKIIDVNEGFYNVFGYTREEATGKTSLELNIYSDKDDRLKLFEGLKKNGRVKDLELVMRKKNGEVVIVSISANTSEINNEKLILAAIRDITEHKKTEALIKQQAETFSAIIENANESIWLLSPDLKVLQFNKTAATRIRLNRGKEIYPGADFKEFLYTGSESVFIPMFNDAVQGKYPERESYQANVNGEGFWLRTRMYPVYDAEKKLIGVTVLAENITDRKKIELILVQSEEKNRALIENISDTIVLLNEKLEVVYQSPSFIRTAGFTLNDHKDKTVLQVMHPDELDLCLQIVERSKKLPDVAIPFQLRTLHKEGHYIWVEGTVTNLLDNENVKAYVLNYRDITQRIHAEKEKAETLEQLMVSESQIRNFAKQLNKTIEDERAHIAREIHDEFGQQLAGVKIGLSVFKKLNGADTKMQENANELLLAVDNSIQSMRKIATSLRPGILDTLGLIPSIKWLAEEFEKRTGMICQLNIDVEQDMYADDLSICYFRICQEALTNISKHAQASAVTIEVIQIGSELTMKIIDNGKGIANKKLENPFSMGLLGMRERANNVDALLTLTSKPNEGTTVELKIKIK